MGEPNKIISISIPQSMDEWLDQHSDINRSDLFRQAVFGRMYPRKNRMSPLVFFISIMGIAFSVALIGISLTPIPLYQVIRTVLPVLGGILAVATGVLIYKEGRKEK
jgi:hypothetical protein